MHRMAVLAVFLGELLADFDPAVCDLPFALPWEEHTGGNALDVPCDFAGGFAAGTGGND